MSDTLTRAEVVGTAFRVMNGLRSTELTYTVSVPADLRPTITEMLSKQPTGATIYQVQVQRETPDARWKVVSISPEPDPDVFPFNVTFWEPPDRKHTFGYSLRAVDIKAARKEFEKLFPSAKIFKIEDWYEF